MDTNKQVEDLKDFGKSMEQAAKAFKDFFAGFQLLKPEAPKSMGNSPTRRVHEQSKTRKKMADASNRINRKRCPGWKF